MNMLVIMINAIALMGSDKDDNTEMLMRHAARSIAAEFRDLCIHNTPLYSSCGGFLDPHRFNACLRDAKFSEGRHCGWENKESSY